MSAVACECRFFPHADLIPSQPIFHTPLPVYWETLPLSHIVVRDIIQASRTPNDSSVNRQVQTPISDWNSDSSIVNNSRVKHRDAFDFGLITPAPSYGYRRVTLDSSRDKPEGRRRDQSSASIQKLHQNLPRPAIAREAQATTTPHHSTPKSLFPHRPGCVRSSFRLLTHSPPEFCYSLRTPLPNCPGHRHSSAS